MPSTYTLNNGIELIATGEQSGTWGDTTNTNLSLVDTALDGQVTVTLPSAGTSGSPNTLAISDGAASDGRNRMVIFNDGGDLGATAYVQLTPNDAEKIIYVRNDLAGSRSIILFQGTYNASNDYEVPAGTTAVIYFDGAGSGAVAANVFNNAYFDSLRLGSVSVTAILDEDNMGSDSATALATQQSIKAYVDSQVTAQDLDFGGDSGTGAVDLDSQTFTIAGTTNEIETSASGQTLTVGLPDDVTIAGDLTVDTDTLFVDAANNEVGIGTSSPSATLNVSNNAGGSNSWTNAGSAIIINEEDTTKPASIKFGPTTLSEGGQIVWGGSGGDGPFIFRNYSTERVRFDEDGRVLIGTDSTPVNATEGKFQFAGTTKSTATGSVVRYSNNSGPAHFFFGKTRSTTIGTVGTSVSSGDTLGYLAWAGDDGTDIGTVAGAIDVQVDGTPGTNDMPGRMRFFTTADGSQTPSERMRIDSAGNVGILNTVASTIASANSRPGLVVGSGSGNNGVTVYSGTGSSSSLFFADGTSGANTYIGMINYNHSEDALAISTTAIEAMRIDSSQRVLIGGTSSVGVSGYTSSLQLQGTSGSSSGISVLRYVDGTGAPVFNFGKTRSGTVGTVGTAVQSGDALGYLLWAGDDGTDVTSNAAFIYTVVDGTPGSNDMPGRLIFSTTSDGNASPTERMRISSNGDISMTTESLSLTQSGDNLIDFIMDSNRPNSGQTLGRQRWYWNGDEVARIEGLTGTDTTNKDDGRIRFLTQTSGDTTLTEAMRIDEEQRVLIGGTQNFATREKEILLIDNSGGGSIAMRRNDSSILEGNDLGNLSFYSADGATAGTDGEAVRINASADGTHSASDYPGRIQLYTTADGASSPTERMRINQAGNVVIQGTDTSATGVNANDSNGNLILNESVAYKAFVATGGTERQFTFDGTSHYYMRATVTTVGNASSNGISVGMIVLGRRDVGGHTYNTADVVGSSTDFTVTSSDSGDTRSWTVKYTNAQSNNNGFMVEVAYYNCRNLNFS